MFGDKNSEADMMFIKSIIQHSLPSDESLQKICIL
jgi:hypothetical protein